MFSIKLPVRRLFIFFTANSLQAVKVVLINWNLYGHLKF